MADVNFVLPSSGYQPEHFGAIAAPFTQVLRESSFYVNLPACWIGEVTARAAGRSFVQVVSVASRLGSDDEIVHVKLAAVEPVMVLSPNRPAARRELLVQIAFEP